MSDLFVLHTVPDLRRAAGGIASALPAMCRALREEGVESRIITFAQDDDGELSDQTTLLTERSPWALDRRLRHETALWREAAHRSGRDFVCHSHGIWSMLNHKFTRAARNQGSPIVISLHGMLLPFAQEHKAFRKALALRLYQARDLVRADAIHVTSKAERVAAEAAGINGRFAEVPFGVDLPVAQAPIKLTAPDQSSQISSSERTALFLGRIHPIKNIDALIEAFALANLKGWRLRIVGPDDGGHRDRLQGLAHRRNVAERISFEEPAFGAVKAELLSDVDLLILPSHSENFGVVVAEALSFGVPVIASTGTPWSVLEPEGCGWWVSPEPQKLAEALQGASLLSRDAMDAMGARGRAYVERYLTWSASAKLTADLYRTVSVPNAPRERTAAS